MGGDARWGPVREECLLTVYTHYGEFSDNLEGDSGGRDRIRQCHLLTSFQEGLEGDRGRDRVQRFCLLTSFQEAPHQKLFFKTFQSLFSDHHQFLMTNKKAW